MAVDLIFSPVFIGLITIVMGLVVANWVQKTNRMNKISENIPGPVGYPLLGLGHMLMRKTHNEVLTFALKQAKEHGETVKAWIGSKLLIAVSNPNDVEIILNSQVHLEKSDEYRFFKPWFGQGLLISKGDHWRHHRKVIAPAFHQNILKSFVPTFYENSLNVVDRMKKEVGKVFDIHDYMSETTVDILLETAMGIQRSAQNNQGYEYAMAVMKMCDIIHKRTYNMLYRWDTFYNKTGLRDEEGRLLGIIHGLANRTIAMKNDLFSKMYKNGAAPSPSFKEIVSETPLTASDKKASGLRDDLDDIDENDVGEKRRLAFLDLMVETARTGGNFTDEDIRDEVNTIMFEGHDTTAAGSSFVLTMLGIHKDIEAKVMKEINGIFGNSDRACTFNDTLEMKYLERVILEALRLYPPVPLIARKVNEDVRLTSGKYTIPKGATVVIPQIVIHRDPTIYPNPLKFDPDNFLPERTLNRHHYSFIPFSAGPRSCVGRKYAMLKLKVLLSTILRKYKVTSPLKEEDFKLQADIILKREEGFQLQIANRA